MPNNMNYRIILEHRIPNENPVITPAVITKDQYRRILKIVFERQFARHGNPEVYLNREGGDDA